MTTTDKLHAAIMNLPLPIDVKLPLVSGDMLSYKFGHRDARHAAAELVSSSAPTKSSLHWRQSTGLLYVLKDGSNSFEVSVTMAHGSRDMGVRSDFATKLLQLIEGAQL